MTHTTIQDKITNQTIYLVNPLSYPVPEIVACMERVLHKKAIYEIIEHGANFEVDTTYSAALFAALQLPSDLETLLQKHLIA